MKEQLEKIYSNAISDIEKTNSLKDLEEIKGKYLSRKGEFNEIKKGLKDLSVEDKKIIEDDIKEANIELPSIDNMIKKEPISVPAPEVNVKPTPVVETPQVTPVSTPNVAPVQTPSVVQPSVTMDVPKPRVNVDADSIVVDENVISDDEFFDDFFGDDE
jgi:hypothetical protein